MLSNGACQCPLHLLHYPTLQNSLNHVVLRTDLEWQTLFPDKQGLLVTANARNRVWHSEDTFEAAFDNFLASIDAATIPIPSVEGGDSEIPIFDARAASLDRIHLKDKITNMSEGTGANKGLTADFIATTKGRMLTLGPTGGVWDKRENSL